MKKARALARIVLEHGTGLGDPAALWVKEAQEEPLTKAMLFDGNFPLDSLAAMAVRAIVEGVIGGRLGDD